jgi:hypothetical protein
MRKNVEEQSARRAPGLNVTNAHGSTFNLHTYKPRALSLVGVSD